MKNVHSSLLPPYLNYGWVKRMGISVMAVLLLAIPSTITVQSSAIASGTKPGPSSASARQAKQPAWSVQMLGLVNAQRARAGAGRMRLCAPLMRAASAYARQMASSGRLHHIGLDGLGPSERVSAAHYRYRVVGENIAVGQRSISSVMRAWLDSPGHRENLLNPQYAHLGLGLASGPGAGSPRYWVQDFGAGGRC